MPNKDEFGPGNPVDRNLNGVGPELGVYIVVPELAGRPDQSPPRGESVIRFKDQPSIVETREARYSPESLMHSPESFHAYEGTDARSFTVEGKFFCGWGGDIAVNNRVLQVIRSLVMPDYNKTGAPPTPVKLFAYGSHNIHALPCLVKSYTMNYPNDVDYVIDKEDENLTMPTVFTLGVTLVEQHSISELRKFSLDDFRIGAMVNRGF